MHARAHRLVAGACTLGLACGGAPHTALSKAGDERDEGAGELAQASLRLSTPAPTDDTRGFADEPRRPRITNDYSYAAALGSLPYGGGPYGAGTYGGAAYGGATYASWNPPQWTYSAPGRAPHYAIVGGLRGAIEGTVTWDGAPPTQLASPCGPLDNPTLHVGRDKALRGAIVFIEKVAIGRATPYYQKPASVGGILAKRGCSLVPAVQIVAPLPGSIAIHGDEQRASIRITPDKTTPTTHELQEAGLVQLEAKPGVTRVDTVGGKVSASWVLGLETPYFAVTDDAGRYRIDELAPGTYDVTFWQPPVASIAPDGTFAYGAPIVLHHSVTVGAGPASKLSVALGR
jgi:hypothetical protein